MKAIRVNYDSANGRVTDIADASVEDWVAVCEAFHDDVHRTREFTDREGFNALYTCFDEEDNRVYYLVEENRSLRKMRRKHFLGHLGVGRTEEA